jgi:hypothetical protein
MEGLYMRKQISFFKFEILCAVFVMILGTLLHFTFEWSHNNLVVGAFSAVNESTWEHLKLVFFPMLLTTIIGYFYTKSSISNYLCAKTQGILIAISFIIIFFYTYTGIIGTNFAILDIASFFVAVILGEYYSYKKIKSHSSCNNLVAIIILIILFLCFIIFTFAPPTIALFKAPVTNNFGIINQ